MASDEGQVAMAFENGVNWEPIAPKDRGKYSTFGTALDSALKELLVEKNSFFDSLVLGVA